jgi:Cys-tRNA(Pro) deacylase
MGKEKTPVTPATRALRAAGISFSGHLYRYEDHGGTAACARAFDVDEHMIIKTLVMEDESKRPFIILMHGDRNVSTKELARAMGVRSVMTCEPGVAQRHTGYQVGGTSPFGMRRPLPMIYINGGRRGLLVSLTPSDAAGLLEPVPVSAQTKQPV